MSLKAGLPSGMVAHDDSDDEFDEEEILGASDSSEEEEDADDEEASSEDDDEEDEEEEEKQLRKGIEELKKYGVKNKKNVSESESPEERAARLELLGQGDGDVRAEGDASSDEEHEKNTIGNVPLHWYDEFDHIGYDKSGKKIIRKEGGMDEVDKYLASKDDPLYRRTVYDAKNDQSTVLTDRELIMVRRMLAGKFPEPGFDAEPDYVDYFTGEQEITPLHSTHEPKRRFIPSKWERMKIMKIVRGIKEGRISVGKKAPVKKKPSVYLLWGEDDTIEDGLKKRKGPNHLPAPKVKLPNHRESYHPPVEYLPTEEEAKEWMEAHPDDRKINYLPQDFGMMRRIPRYANFVQERFDRCLDLYLCPRKEKQRLNIDPESLVPRLPKPSELRPYPSSVAVTYFGHHGRVRSIAVSPSGEFLASGGDDQIVRIWEVDTGRCLASYDLSEVNLDKTQAIIRVAWNPQPKYHVLAVAIGQKVVLLYTGVGTFVSAPDAEETYNLLTGHLRKTMLAQAKHTEKKKKEESDGESSESEEEDEEGEEDNEAEAERLEKLIQESDKIVQWSGDEIDSASMLMDGKFAKTIIEFQEKKDLVDLVWHTKGEYLATVCNTEATNAQVTVHHVGKRISQRPLNMTKAQRVQRVLFHHKKPILFVATKLVVNVYHLVKQKRLAQLKSGARWISDIALHPSGDNLILSSYDRRVSWFDLDLSSRPWKTLKYHQKAVRSVAFHSRYPLMASAADDGVVHIFHARVVDDFAKDPFLVPVKILKGHTPALDGLGVLDCVFHPSQPWIFSAGADGRIQLYQNLN